MSPELLAIDTVTDNTVIAVADQSDILRDKVSDSLGAACTLAR